MPRPLMGEEEELADLLQGAGLGRAGARGLTALLRLRQATAAELALVARVARQDVGVAMRDLAARGLVDIEKVPREGAGRPLLRYALAVTRAEAVTRLYDARREALEAELAALARLKARFAGKP